MSTREMIFALAIGDVPGIVSIAWPIIRWWKTKKDGYLTMVCLHSVLSGLGMIAWTVTILINGYPTYLPFFFVGLCLLVCFIDVGRVLLARIRRGPKPILAPTPAE